MAVMMSMTVIDAVCIMFQNSLERNVRSASAPFSVDLDSDAASLGGIDSGKAAEICKRLAFIGYLGSL